MWETLLGENRTELVYRHIVQQTSKMRAPLLSGQLKYGWVLYFFCVTSGTMVLAEHVS